MILETNSMETE